MTTATLEKVPNAYDCEVALERPRAVLLAGGGGGAAFGPELAEHYDLTIITGTADRGGATEEVRATYGGGAPGDLRNILAAVSGNAAGPLLNKRLAVGEGLAEFQAVGRQFIDALSNRNEALAGYSAVPRHDIAAVERTVALTDFLGEYLMQDTGRQDLGGHTWGNLFITALRLEHDDDLAAAAAAASRLVEAKATVLPSSTQDHDLLMLDGDTIVATEKHIDEYTPHDAATAELALEAVDPHAEVRLHPEADAAISNADVLMMAPGSLYSSQLPILSVGGMREAIARQRQRAGTGRFVLFSNLVEEPTNPNLSMAAHAQRLYAATGRPFDALVYNTRTEDLIGQGVPLQAEAHQQGGYALRMVGAVLARRETVVFDASDAVARAGLRSPVRHDVAAAIAAAEQAPAIA